MNLQWAQEKLGKKLADVSEVANGVLRGIRRNGGRDVAAYIFDLSNHLPETVGGLSDYLDDIIGPSYFDRDASPDLRWNSYLYFVIDKKLASHPEFPTIKRNVESDRSYARKFVVTEDDFDRVLTELDSVAVVDEPAGPLDVVKDWDDVLDPVGLADVLDDTRPIADIVRTVSSGSSKQTKRTKRVTGVEAGQKLVRAHLESIDLTNFRKYPRRQLFGGFGKANLIFGSNGVGKTSLLEGLEFLYCGANRRSGVSATTTVRGVLASGEEVETSGLQAVSDFKTRQRLWYGADDNSRQNKLPNQFARFSFLNTDAAAELTLLKEDSTGSNAESLAALLSGHEATLMWRRIQDLRKAIAEELRSKRSERAVAELDRKAKEQERQRLEAAPAQSDVAFSLFKKNLERIGWASAPSSKNEVTEEFIESLSEVGAQLSVVQRIDWLDLPVGITSIHREDSILQGADEGLQHLLADLRNDEQQRGIVAKRVEKAKARLAALDAIPVSTFDDLRELSSTLGRIDSELSQVSRAVAALPSAAAPEGWESTWGNSPVPSAVSDSKAKHADVSNQLNAAQQRLNDQTRAQSALKSAMTELHSWTQKVLAHRHSDTSCPVCGTGMEPGELLGRMRHLLLEPADAAVFDLRLHVEQLTASKERATIELTWLVQLDRFIHTYSDEAHRTTVSAAQQSASRLRDRHRILDEARQEASAGLKAYAQLGWSLTAIEDLCSPVDGDDSPIPQSLNLLEAKQRLEQFLLKLEGVGEAVEGRLAQTGEELRRRLSVAAIRTDVPLTDAVQQLAGRRRIVKRAAEVCDEVRTRVDAPHMADLHSLASSIELAVLGGKKVLSALQSDNASTSQLASIRKQLDTLIERLGRTKDSISRLTRALKVLDDLIERQSLDRANAAVVTATYTVADAIFERIHAPSEYMVTADPQGPLRRRDDPSRVVPLNQVSTGQRAAYALSLFLAMNARVKEGPKAILLDDPISHVDDLNALSFMDYLRDLILKSDRQVFFATADEKIAGLFAHKFGFLAEEFETFELTRS